MKPYNLEETRQYDMHLGLCISSNASSNLTYNQFNQLSGTPHNSAFPPLQVFSPATEAWVDGH